MDEIPIINKRLNRIVLIKMHHIGTLSLHDYDFIRDETTINDIHYTKKALAKIENVAIKTYKLYDMANRCDNPIFIKGMDYELPLLDIQYCEYYCKNNKIEFNETMKNNLRLYQRTILRSHLTKHDIMSHLAHFRKTKTLDVIRYYTINGSDDINGYLRFGKYTNHTLNNVIDKLTVAFNKSPPFNYAQRVYRFVRDDSFLIRYNIGDTITDAGFMSTTRNFLYKSGVFGNNLMIINIPKKISGIAILIEHISHFGFEREILLNKNSMFRLIARNSDVLFKTEFKINNKYELLWIGIKSSIPRLLVPKKITRVDFLINVKNPVKYLLDRVNENNQISTMINDIEIIITIEQKEDMDVYSKHFALNNFILLHAQYNGSALFFIEVDQDHENTLHINYYNRFNYVSNEIGDNIMTLFYAKVGYFFNCYNSIFYCRYTHTDITYNEDIHNFIVDGTHNAFFVHFQYSNIKMLFNQRLTKAQFDYNKDIYYVFIESKTNTLLEFYKYLIANKIDLIIELYTIIDKFGILNDFYILNNYNILYDLGLIDLYPVTKLLTKTILDKISKKRRDTFFIKD